MNKKSVIITAAVGICALAAGGIIFLAGDKSGNDSKVYTADNVIEDTAVVMPEADKDSDITYVVGILGGVGISDGTQAEEATGGLVADAGESGSNTDNATVAVNTAGGSPVVATDGGKGTVGTTTEAADSGKGNSSQSTAQGTATATTEAAKQDSGSGDAGKKWHDPVYGQIWVVDEEAWTEEVPVYETQEVAICKGCGGYMYTNDDIANHPCLSSYYSDCLYVQTGTQTIYHEEVGHYETQIIQEGYWE